MSSQNSLRPLVPAKNISRPSKVFDYVSSGIERATTACRECQRRKTKCRGGVPCDLCMRTNMECIKSEDRDGRRKLSYKRKIASLEKDRSLLLRLVEALRKCNETDVNKLTTPIKHGASLVEVERIIAEQFGVHPEAPKGSQGDDTSAADESGIVKEQLKLRHLLC